MFSDTKFSPQRGFMVFLVGYLGMKEFEGTQSENNMVARYM
jgi:hypothetical protein